MHQLYPTTPNNEDQDVLAALREFFSRCPQAMSEGTETLAQMLWEGRCLCRSPVVFEVEAALEALRLDSGEVAA